MSTSNLRVARRLARFTASAVLATPLAGALYAQQSASTSPALPAVALPSQTEPAPSSLNLDLDAALHTPLSDSVLSGNSSSSASEQGAADPALLAEALPSPDGNLQPPPYRRRRYGTPSYSDRMHNADGSSRLAFVAGGGLNVPVGSASSDFLKTGWRFEGGAGINFSRKLGVMLQFDWDDFGLPGSVLANQEKLYTAITSDTTGAFTGLDGHSHIWSFTANPTFTFFQGDKVGAYGVVGGGFYHKVTNFTVPAEGQYCDYYYGCYTYTANQTIDHYTSNAPGVTGGVGMTYKFSRFANEKFFVEARFVHTFNQARLGDPAYTGATTGTAYNLYPPNSNETSYIPITFGVRF